MEIKVVSIMNRWDNSEIYRGDHATMKEAVEAAVKSDANLSAADLTNASLRNADLTNADLYGASLRGANWNDVPVVENLDVRMEDVTRPIDALYMGDWHTCETTHCRAGWAIFLAGEAGKELERKIGPNAAGALIYAKSAGHVPNFFASDEDARADIVRRAEQAKNDATRFARKVSNADQGRAKEAD